jgi:cell wall-associated NlpC family hydrolase
LTSATVANADSVGSQQQKVNQLADQLDSLQNRIGLLDEEYGAAQDKKDQLDKEIADSQARIAQQQARLTELSGVLGDIAVDKYVTGSAMDLSPLFSNAAAYTEAEQKDSFSRLALDNGSGSTDEMLALAEDLSKEQDSLSRKQQQVADLVASLNSKVDQANTLQAEYEQKLASAQADLATAIEQERERRAVAAAAAEVAKQKQEAAAAAASASAAAAAAAANNKKSSALTPPRGGGTGAPVANTGGAPAAPDPTPNGGGGGGNPAPPDLTPPPSAPPVSSMASIAVNAAMSQLGVPYRFAAESPGVAFDCSGLTKYAWGQAGVYLPHQSGAQYGSIPHITQSEIQPGDLIFYKSPIGHVAMYIGGGSLIHAPRSGDVVKVAVVDWAKVVGIGRPG